MGPFDGDVFAGVLQKDAQSQVTGSLAQVKLEQSLPAQNHAFHLTGAGSPRRRLQTPGCVDSCG